ncbi:peptidase S15 [Alcanivorax nanhaiticus]|uniref:Peptidase S15 n=1 Tax=Alcanivorax nanhaiticus TaxID=1177154 RepID=A0A095SG25_9GAMM|nr:CocE/NonD family hydrolase [Alcanivorax nanhaiticus]KGD63279.1 peptidase S15 [Alcanivorax nanhaiticus]
MKRLLLFIIAFPALISALSGCAMRTPPAIAAESALTAQRFQIVIKAHDGGDIAATLWQPALPAGQTAPLMLHTHGFGLRRMNGGIDLYALLPSGQIAKQMWQDGYWLITWDQRGHGGTDGVIDVMNPDLEVRDLTTILDWAEQNIPRLARDDNDDIKVGMVGESYGGGVQLIGTMLDARIDALVPMTTWYDLETALAPGDVPKGGWIKTLKLMGDWVNFRKLNPPLRDAFKKAMDGEMDEQVRQEYASHSMAYYCNQDMAPNANALLIQGFRDVLFDVDQALEARDCFARNGRDVTLIVQQGGHLLPLEQHSPSLPVWYLEKELHCGETALDSKQVAVDWLKSQLDNGQPPALPPVCVSSEGWGIALNDWPQSRDTYPLATVELSGHRSGSWRWWTGMTDWFAGWRSEAGLSETFAEARDAGIRPAFIPLHTASSEEYRVGTPLLHLTSEGDGPVLAALVKREAGKAHLSLVNDQLAPIPLNQDSALPPIAVALEPGDQLGLVLFSRHPQFNTRHIGFGDATLVSGSLSLPVTLKQLAEADPAKLNRPAGNIAITNRAR